MRILAIICNIVLFLFIGLVLATDGLPTETAYMVFTVWSFLTLILSAAVLSRRAPSLVTKIAATVFNVVMLGHAGWALMDQYPHPREEGFVPFVILLLVTPVLNIVALWRTRARGVQPAETA